MTTLLLTLMAILTGAILICLWPTKKASKPATKIEAATIDFISNDILLRGKN